MFPKRSHDETDEQFAMRVRVFRANLPRHSDSSRRLALAFRAFVLSGEKTYSAAHYILEILRAAPARKLQEYTRLGIGYAYKPIDSKIGSTNRGRRAKRKKRGLTRDEREAQTIRVQASKFIREHDDFDALFDRELALYRGQFSRDTEWHAASEQCLTKWAVAFQERCEPFDWWAAMPLATTAYLY